MESKSALRHSLFLAASSLVASTSAYAQTAYTWDITPGAIGAGDSIITGGAGTWNTTNGNWTTDAGANNVAWVNAGSAPFNDAVFGGTAGTVTLGEAISLRNMTINTANYVITGSALDFTSGNINITAASTIRSAITGSPTMTDGGATGSITVLDPTSGNMTLGAITRSVDKHLYLRGSSTSNNSIASIAKGHANAKLRVESGNWTFGNVYAGEFLMTGGTLILNGTLNNEYRATKLNGGTLHYNNAGAVRDGRTIFGGTNNDFIMGGGSMDQTSGAPITTSTHNPDMEWMANWTFIGSNGANSDLFLGTGRALLNGTRQVTVQHAATTLALGGVISGTTASSGLTKAGPGTLELRGNNTYTGPTAINAGTLAINGATASINTSSGITVAAGGTLRYNSSTALTKAPTLDGTGTGDGLRAVLGGTGPINVAVTLDNVGDVLSPGNSPGIQTYTVGQTWSSFSYDWELNNFTGNTAGTDFDQIGITGTLDLTGGSGSYILNVLGLTAGNVAGLVPNFSEVDRSWIILTTSTGLTGFNAANWSVNTTGFTDPDTGTWALAQSGDNLVLSYTAVPEPRAALLGGLGLLMLLRRRRQQMVGRGGPAAP